MPWIFGPKILHFQNVFLDSWNMLMVITGDFYGIIYVYIYMYIYVYIYNIWVNFITTEPSSPEPWNHGLF